MSLDDKVSKYFPDLTRASEITIRQLLSHTAGYEDYAPQDYFIPEWSQPTTPMAVVDRWAKNPLDFDPGTRWQYSNTNYKVAGLIFEKASGEKLVPFLEHKIFEPLGMHSAGDCEVSSPRDAAAFTRYAGGPPRPVQREAAGWNFDDSGLCMTASDLARWDMALLRKEVLSSTSYEEFTHEVRLANGNATHYALGLQIGEFNAIPTISHAGGVSGFEANNTIYLTQKGAVVILTNADGVNLIYPLTRQLARILFLDEPPSADEKGTAQVKAILESLAKGKLDRALFTDDANSYFDAQALRDIRKSLITYGKLHSVTRTSETQRAA